MAVLYGTLWCIISLCTKTHERSDVIEIKGTGMVTVSGLHVQFKHYMMQLGRPFLRAVWDL